MYLRTSPGSKPCSGCRSHRGRTGMKRVCVTFARDTGNSGAKHLAEDSNVLKTEQSPGQVARDESHTTTISYANPTYVPGKQIPFLRTHAIPPQTPRHPNLYRHPRVLSVLLCRLIFSQQPRQNPTRLLVFCQVAAKHVYSFLSLIWKRSKPTSVPLLSLLTQGTKEMDFDPLEVSACFASQAGVKGPLFHAVPSYIFAAKLEEICPPSTKLWI